MNCDCWNGFRVRRHRIDAGCGLPRPPSAGLVSAYVLSGALDVFVAYQSSWLRISLAENDFLAMVRAALRFRSPWHRPQCDSTMCLSRSRQSARREPLRTATATRSLCLRRKRPPAYLVAVTNQQQTVTLAGAPRSAAVPLFECQAWLMGAL